MPRRAPPSLPRADSALRKLGSDIRDARRRRLITIAQLADRALTSHVTVGRIERGDPGVSMGAWANVLDVLGLVDRLGALADASRDVLALPRERELLPKRVRVPRDEDDELD